MGLVPGPLLSPERGQRRSAAPFTRPCVELPLSVSLEAGSGSVSVASGASVASVTPRKRAASLSTGPGPAGRLHAWGDWGSQICFAEFLL